MKSMDKALRNELKTTLDQQVNLGVESIFSAVFGGPNRKTVSLHHLLNRVMMVAQVPITFVIFRGAGRNSKNIRKTNKHALHKALIEKSIEQAKPEDYYNLWDEPEEGTSEKFRLLVLMADSLKEGYVFRPLAPIYNIDDVVTLWGAAAYKITKLFDSKLYARYGNTFFNSIRFALEQQFADDEFGSGEPIENMLPIQQSEVIAFNEELLRNSTQYELIGKGVLDRVFQKIERNITRVTHDEKEQKRSHPTNFILFARDYVDCPAIGWRYGGAYKYRLRVLLCSTQKEEIRAHLKTMKVNREKHQAAFRQQITDCLQDKGKSLAIDVDKKFWEMIDEEDYAGILNILSGYFSEFSRSMADPVFDAISFFRQPFSNDAGMGRCFSDGEEIPKKLKDLPREPMGTHGRHDDLLRVVICQYLFDAMAAGTHLKNTHLQLMLNPIEVGGRVWAVAGYATRSKNPSTEFENVVDVQQFDRFWWMNYHIFRDVNERMKKNLRTYMNRFYESFVAKQYASWLMQGYSGALGGTNKATKLKQVEEDLNSRLKSLACIFPYNVVKGSIRKTDSDWPVPSTMIVVGSGEGKSYPHKQRALAGKNWAVYIDVTEESKFPPTPGVRDTKIFVDAVDVAVAMTDKTIRLVVGEHGLNQPH